MKEGWLFEPSSIYGIYEKINQIDFSKNNNYCLALYGNAFCGKDCILKLVGSYLEKKGVEVLELKERN